MSVLREDIRLGHAVKEYLVALPIESAFIACDDDNVAYPPIIPVAVYEYYSQIDKHSFRYVLKGVRMHNYHDLVISKTNPTSAARTMRKNLAPDVLAQIIDELKG